MEPFRDDLRERMLDAVEAWAEQRYQARLKDVRPEQITITRASSDSEYDYLVTVDSLVGSAPLRVRVAAGQDGSLHISD